ncbi:phage/plasmid primase, P4 family [Acidiphilium sp.]|uniref:phage/plasmid primase, P4 family n=1 Tax=Acidiphilium sp. TaxID=527 RepID=UPI003D036235
MDAETMHRSPADDAIEIARLMMLDPMNYDRQKLTSAGRLGVTVATLDRQVTAARNATRRRAATDAPEYSDDDLALRFSHRHADALRYTAKFGRWHEWTGTHWRDDETLHAFTLARAICRDAARSAELTIAHRIASAGTVAAVERLARNDPRHAATVDQWDRDPWLLATPGGTVELRTGRPRPADPADHCTKTTSVAPGGDCPMWLRFLDQITAGDADLQSFLQRAIGYGLTGQTSEHALFFFYGTGGNGKGAFLNTISAILADYASIAGMETFTASTSDRHPTDLAMLRGARLAVSQETEQGKAWAESRIKAMMGGDPITARFMRQDFFTYSPQFKLIIAGNHKPSLKNVDEAIRRRFHLVPFTVTIPAGERDKDLPEKLKAEHPGILQWAIEGCLEWQRIGLAPPEAVTDATAEYLADEDALMTWAGDRCTLDRNLWGQSSHLFKSWVSWCDDANEPRGTQKQWRASMIAHGFNPHKAAKGEGFMGLALQENHDEGGGIYDR